MACVGLTTYSFAVARLRARNPDRRFTATTVLIVNLSIGLSALGLFGIAWLPPSLLPIPFRLFVSVYFVGGVVFHAGVDRIAKLPNRAAGRFISLTSIVAIGALALTAIGHAKRSDTAVHAGSLCQFVGFLLLQFGYLIDGGVVLGARFLPAEIRPALLAPYEA
jgi:hypothetical protein